MRLVLRIAIGVSLGLSLLQPSLAQRQPYGVFRGRIVDEKGQIIRGAVVTVESANHVRTVKPNPGGHFGIQLPVGMYRITVKKTSFSTYELNDVNVRAGGYSSHVFKLQRSGPTAGAVFRAQVGTTPADCPTITVACPDYGPIILFFASVRPDNPDLKITYQWTVITRGEIESGQGTAKITVNAERNGKGIGAAVEVLGLPSKCAKNASCYVTHF